MALRGQVHHRIRLVRGKDPVERRPVANVRALEGIAVAAGDAVEVREVRRIGQRIEVDHLVPVRDRLPHHGRADEARAARHQNSHAFTPYSNGDTQSRNAGARLSLSESVSSPADTPQSTPMSASFHITPPSLSAS